MALDITFMVQLDAETKERLRERAYLDRVSQAEVVRLALAAYLSRRTLVDEGVPYGIDEEGIPY